MSEASGGLSASDIAKAVIGRKTSALDVTEAALARIKQRDTILKAGLALQQAGVIAANVDVKKALDDLIDDRFVSA